MVGKITHADLESHRLIVNSKVEDLRSILPLYKETFRRLVSEKLASLSDVRSFVDARGAPAESTHKFSSLIEFLISAQADRSRAYPLQGLENKLIGLSIFESAKDNAGLLRVFVSTVLGQDAPVTSADLSRIVTFKLGIQMNLSSKGLVMSDRARSDINHLLETDNWKRILHTLDKVQERSNAGKYGEDSKVFFDNVTTMIDELARIIGQEASDISSIIHHTHESANFNFWMYTLISLAFICVIAFIAWRVAREVITRLTDATNDLSKTASIVTGTSNQLSSASEQLSAGATEGAASLEETVASIDVLSNMVKQNAEHANEASSLSRASVQAADSGEAEIQKLVKAMSDIAVGSRKIEEIINVIDDIAFQTNLLALNAAVEAARAGEQGKGFAVVAEAVRSLAQRSANAARDVNNLIRANVEQTHQGAKIADHSGAVLKDIVGSIKKVAGLIAEIAEASKEQSTGLQQISQAMSQLDTVTQQNAASAERAADSSRDLSEQAAALQNMIENLTAIVRGTSDSAWAESGTRFSAQDDSAHGGPEHEMSA